MSRTRKPSRAKLAKQRRIARKAYERAIKTQTQLLNSNTNISPEGTPAP
jgi:hypothetical protein